MPGSPPYSSLLPPPPPPRRDSPPPVARRSSGWIRPLPILGLLIAIPSGLLLGLDIVVVARAEELFSATSHERS